MSTADRRAREKAQRRREILDAAREVFFERGFHSPTVDDIAARAEVSKGTIYLYFVSKEEILAHLLLEGLNQLVAQMEEMSKKEPSQAAEPAMRGLATAYLTFCQSNPSYFRLIMAFDRGRFEEQITPKLYKQILNRSLEGLTLLARTVEQGKDSGVFNVQDPWLTAGSIWAALNGVLVLVAHPLRRQMLKRSVDDMFQATLDLVIRGLKDGQVPIQKEGRG